VEGRKNIVEKSVETVNTWRIFLSFQQLCGKIKGKCKETAQIRLLFSTSY
jgi:hypothetical protein